jgi:hypothetical protein
MRHPEFISGSNIAKILKQVQNDERLNIDLFSEFVTLNLFQGLYRKEDAKTSLARRYFLYPMIISAPVFDGFFDLIRR